MNESQGSVLVLLALLSFGWMLGGWVGLLIVLGLLVVLNLLT